MNKDLRHSAVSRVAEACLKIERLYELYAKSKGINFITIFVLDLLVKSKELYTQKEICENLSLPKQLVNSIITSFWEKDYVVLKEAKDRRHKQIILTSAGKEYAEKILNPLREAEYKAWDSFTVEEVSKIAEGMEQYEKDFEAILKSQGCVPSNR